jgi:micrococcal nuclease
MTRKSKLLLLLILFLALTVSALAQETISPEDSANYIGQQKTVCGMVASAHYAFRSNGHPTFLNLNKPYPNQIFTVLIWGSDRGNFEKPPEVLYRGNEISVTGTIRSIRGLPEIIVKDPSQIKVK